MPAISDPSKINGKDNWNGNDQYDRDDPVQAKLIKEMQYIRSELLINQPFYGIIGLGKPIVFLVGEAAKVIPRAATDGANLFFNPEFLATGAGFIEGQGPTRGLNYQELQFLYLHELMHCINAHIAGKEFAFSYADNPKALNAAQDFGINSGIISTNLGVMPETEGGACHDTKYDDAMIWGTKEIYFDLLDQDPNNIPDPIDTHIEIEIEIGGHGGDEDEGGDEDGQGQGSGDGEGDDGEGQGQGQGKGGRPGNGQGKGNLKVKMSQQDANDAAIKAADSLRRAIIQAKSQQGGDGAGSIPVGYERMIGELERPKINWRSATRKFVRNLVSRKRSYRRLARSGQAQGLSLRGYSGRKKVLDLAVGVDASGSVGQHELTKFMSELKGMLDAFSSQQTTGYRLHVFCFDGDVIPSSYAMIESKTGTDPSKHIQEYLGRVSGGGGTNFESCWKFMKDTAAYGIQAGGDSKNRIKPKGFVMLTDGMPYGDDYVKHKDYVPTLFCTIGNESWRAPFGTTIPIDDI